MNRRGVCYDVGRVMLGNNWRPIFNVRVAHREIKRLSRTTYIAIQLESAVRSVQSL